MKCETVPEAVRSKAVANGDQCFLRHGDERVTYKEMDETSNAIANGLRARGIEPTDNIAILMQNSVEYVYALFGVAKTGATAVTLNAQLRGADLCYQINNSDSETIIVESGLADHLADVLKDTTVDRIIEIGDEPTLDSIGFETLRQNSTEPPEVTVNPEDPCTIVFTSGTTGMPKGVVLPHRSYITTPRQYTERIGLRVEDVWYTSLPLYHVNAQQTTLMGSLLSDATVALGRQFSASKFWDRIDHHNATIFNYIGAILSILQKRDEGPETNSLRIGSGAGAPAETIRAFEARYNVTILEGYGLTETGTSSTKVEATTERSKRYESVGSPVDHFEVAILDENDAQVPPGKKGEIAVRPNEPHVMMLEYYDRPDATVDAWQNLWFHTGDVGYLDDDGYLHFVDRKTQMIRHRGENISSSEVEQTINSHPDVKECAVVPIPTELGDEDVKAYVVGTVEPEDVIEICTRNLAEFKVPRYIEIVDSLPKTHTERVNKSVLKERGIDGAWDQRAGDGEADP